MAHMAEEPLLANGRWGLHDPAPVQDVRETIERRKELAVKCEADRAAVQAALVRRGPVAQQLQVCRRESRS